MTPDEALALVTEYRDAIEAAQVAKREFKLARKALHYTFAYWDESKTWPAPYRSDFGLWREPDVRYDALNSEYVRCLHELQRKSRVVCEIALRLRTAP